MKSVRRVAMLAVLLLTTVFSFAQKTISEGTMTYDIVIQSGNKEPQIADALDGGTITTYIKGGQSRSDMVSALGKETTIHDTKTGNAVILKELGLPILRLSYCSNNSLNSSLSWR